MRTQLRSLQVSVALALFTTVNPDVWAQTVPARIPIASVANIRAKVDHPDAGFEISGVRKLRDHPAIGAENRADDSQTSRNFVLFPDDGRRVNSEGKG